LKISADGRGSCLKRSDWEESYLPLSKAILSRILQTKEFFWGNVGILLKNSIS
jgi:hypothetical protein